MTTTCAKPAHLHLERLETREVPAIVLQGTFNESANTVTTNGGLVTIEEVALSSNSSGTGRDFVVNESLTGLLNVSKSGTESDNIALSNEGERLTLSDSDGIYIRFTSSSGTFFQFVGTQHEVQGVTGLNVNLRLGGNDRIDDFTDLTATINGGPGDDVIDAASAGKLDPLLFDFLRLPSALPIGLLPLFQERPGYKAINGGADNDIINGPFFGIFNRLDGGSGTDLISGGFGPDIIVGSEGLDFLLGRTGRDIYDAIDFNVDFVFNQIGDTVFADPVDLVAVR